MYSVCLHKVLLQLPGYTKYKQYLNMKTNPPIPKNVNKILYKKKYIYLLYIYIYIYV